MTDDMTVEQWLAIRKEPARQIDPETAEVDWWYVQDNGPLRRRPRSAGGVPADWAGVLRLFSRERCVGLVL